MWSFPERSYGRETVAARGRIEPVGEATGRSYARESVANDESPLRREELGWGREPIPNET